VFDASTLGSKQGGAAYAKHLNALGADGWELVSFAPYRGGDNFYLSALKRPKK
jgi:hypothetical protein